MAVKKITEVDASEEVKDGAYLLATQQEKAEDGTAKETLVRTALAAIAKALLRNGMAVSVRVENSGTKREVVVLQGTEEIARISAPGEAVGDSVVFGQDNTVADGKNAAVFGTGNTVTDCADGAVIAGHGMAISDKNVVAAFGNSNNRILLYADGTVSGTPFPNMRILSDASKLGHEIFTTANMLYVYSRSCSEGDYEFPDNFYSRYIPLAYSIDGDPGTGATVKLVGYDHTDDTIIKGVCEYTLGDGSAPIIWTLEKNAIAPGSGNGSVQMHNVPGVTAPNDANRDPAPEPTTKQPQANGNGAFAIGIGTIADGDVSVAMGINTRAGYVRSDGSRNVGSCAEGINVWAKSSGSHAEGFETQALASNAHTEGFKNIVNSAAWSGHAEGRENIVNSRAGHAEGYKNKIEANAEDSHVEGQNNTLSGVAGHAEGQNNKVSGKAAHVEGSNCEATGNYSHAEGRMSKASGWGAHAEGAATSDGTTTEATAKGSHAEGVGTKATGADAHAEGALTEASGAHSHAEGYKTKAVADYSHAGGACNETHEKFSTVVGKYAKVIESGSGILFAVGNGTGATAAKRSNAFEVHADGTALLGDKVVLTMADYNTLLAKINALADRVAALEGGAGA